MADKKQEIKQRAFCRGCKKMTLQAKPDSGASTWTCSECKADASKDKPGAR